MFQNTINLKNDQHRNKHHDCAAWPVNSQEDKHQSNDHLNILMTFEIFAILS